jgi:hypothetical protein
LHHFSLSALATPAYGTREKLLFISWGAGPLLLLFIFAKASRTLAPDSPDERHLKRAIYGLAASLGTFALLEFLFGVSFHI